MTSRTSLTLTEKQAREVETYCRIARENDALISLRELIALVSINASEEELVEAFGRDPRLSSRFAIEAGYLIEKTPGLEKEAGRIVSAEEKSKQRARLNLETARAFGRFLTKGTLLVSVGGANSYLSAREDEDIDYFCVTKTGHLWTFMVRGLLLARIYRMTNARVPELCFSFEMDERWAERTFSRRQDPIFARDALTVKLIAGKSEYHRLLQEASWMKQYFPALYAMRIRESNSGGQAAPLTVTKPRPSVLNLGLYYTVGSFLRIKSWALNRRFAKRGLLSSEFEARIGPDVCIYESNRYRMLGRMYHELEESG